MQSANPLKLSGSRAGVTTVEFALTFPVLLVLVIGMIEFVRMNHLHHTADNAAYEAARHVVVPGASSSEALQHARDLLARAGVRSSSIEISPPTISNDTAEVTVNVSISLAGNSWLPRSLTNNYNIQRDCTLMTERYHVTRTSGTVGGGSGGSRGSSGGGSGSGTTGGSNPYGGHWGGGGGFGGGWPSGGGYGGGYGGGRGGGGYGGGGYGGGGGHSGGGGSSGGGSGGGGGGGGSASL